MKWALLVLFKTQQTNPMLRFKSARNPRQMGLVALLRIKRGIHRPLVRVPVLRVPNAHNAARVAISSIRYGEASAYLHRGACQAEWRAARDLEDIPPFLDRRAEHDFCSEDDIAFLEGGEFE
jgi:hypothetical protein